MQKQKSKREERTTNKLGCRFYFPVQTGAVKRDTLKLPARKQAMIQGESLGKQTLGLLIPPVAP